jgi:hypothetical protein
MKIALKLWAELEIAQLYWWQYEYICCSWIMETEDETTIDDTENLWSLVPQTAIRTSESDRQTHIVCSAR